MINNNLSKILCFSNKISEGDLIGEGGFGEVLEGKYHCLDLAIKKPKTRKIELEKEVNILKSLKYPGLPAFYGISLGSNQVKSLIIERISGNNLQELMEKKYEFNDLLKIKFLIEISWILGYVHSNKIIHRDVKPNNIMIDKKCKAKLLDFGISKIADNTMTTDNARIGTVLYYSPEHCSFDSNSEEFKVSLSKKSDIWALGLIINQVFSGDTPWADYGLKNENAIMKVILLLHKKEKFNPSQKITNEEIKQIISKCTEYEKKNRYTSEQVLLHGLFAMYNVLSNQKTKIDLLYGIINNSILTNLQSKNNLFF